MDKTSIGVVTAVLLFLALFFGALAEGVHTKNSVVKVTTEKIHLDYRNVTGLKVYRFNNKNLSNFRVLGSKRDPLCNTAKVWWNAKGGIVRDSLYVR